MNYLFIIKAFELFGISIKSFVNHLQMASLISGKEISANIRQKLKDEISQIRATKQQNFAPGLVIVQVGDRSESNVYIKMKLKAAEEIGIKANHLKLSRYCFCVLYRN